jgi:hypothetical protein
MADQQVRYQHYVIKPKLDFPPAGFLINGEQVKSGWIASFRGANVMPGATWFPTIEEAKIGCDALDLAKEICRDEKDVGATFWRLMALSRQRITQDNPPDRRRTLAEELQLLGRLIGTDHPQGIRDMREIVEWAYPLTVSLIDVTTRLVTAIENQSRSESYTADLAREAKKVLTLASLT